jgi:hypothetical protein
MHTPETELHERGLRARLHERSVGICRRFLHEVRAPMGDGKVLEKMGERRKYVRRDATVGRLSAIFLEDMEGSVKPSTLACYRRNIQCHILPALGECVAAELTAAEINDYIQQLQEDYSPKLVREIGGLLLRIVGMAGVGYGEDVTLPKVRQKAVEVFTEPELKQMGQVILRRPDRTGLGVLLTAYTGLRLGELCGLQWQDVDVGTAAYPADGGAHRADRRRDVPDGAATENGKFRTLDTHSERDAADAEARDKAAGQLPADRRGDRP